VWVLTEARAPQWHPGMKPCPTSPPRIQLTPAQQDSARIANQYPRSCPGM
jgi:hypothetical protein